MVVGADGLGCVGVVPGTGVVGAVTVGVAVVGGWTAGSDFSPQPAATNVAETAIPSVADRSRRRPAFDSKFTGGNLTQAFSSCRPGGMGRSPRSRCPPWPRLGRPGDFTSLYGGPPGKVDQSSRAGRPKRSNAPASIS